MANSGKNTNGSQFFIVQTQETFDEEYLQLIEQYYNLNFNEAAIEGYKEIGGTPWLYRSHTVFGQVYEGYDVLDAVAGVKLLDVRNGIPAETVVIEQINVFQYK